jgi:hypothetical protein
MFLRYFYNSTVPMIPTHKPFTKTLTFKKLQQKVVNVKNVMNDTTLHDAISSHDKRCASDWVLVTDMQQQVAASPSVLHAG